MKGTYALLLCLLSLNAFVLKFEARKMLELVQGAVVLRVDCAATNDGAQNRSLRVILRRNLCEISRENDKVGVLASFQFALLPFFKLRIGGTRSVCADAISE